LEVLVLKDKITSSNHPKNTQEGSSGKLSLGTRLFILFFSLLIVSVLSVGASSYIKAKNMAIDTIESRLGREAEIMGYIAENLKFVYVSDEDYFRQQLEVNVRSQQKKLENDGITSDFYYIADGKVTPFKVSQKSSNTFTKETIDAIQKAKIGVIHEEMNGSDYTIAFQEMKEINGIYVLLIPTDTYMQPVHSMLYFTIAVIVISMAAATVLISLFVRKITKPLNQLRGTMRTVREGSLQISPAIETSIPEIVSLQKSYNSMIQQMMRMVRELTQTTKELGNTGDELKDSSQSTLASSQQLVSAINLVKTGAEQTAASSETSVRSFKDMTDMIEAILSNMNSVSSSSAAMNDSAATGDRNIGQLITTIHSFEADFKHLNETIHQVKEYAKSITNLVGMVQAVADQTRLLSLNASIEAARAGEAGKGFAVVANEVRNLAEQSANTTDEISQAISNMEKITAGATEEFELIHMKIKKNLTMASSARFSFDELMKEISDVSQKLHSMQDELENLGETLPQLAHNADSFLAVSQETLASAEEMLSASEIQIHQMESTDQIGLKLNSLAKSLSEITQQFSVKDKA
jgi:methyl-accepting chemotaxis protein